jgi:hypothetical protein
MNREAEVGGRNMGCPWCDRMINAAGRLPEHDEEKGEDADVSDFVLNTETLPWNETGEIVRDGERGVRAVGPGCAEIQIALPGSIAYYDPVPWT